MDRLTFVDGVGMNEIKRCFDCGESQAGSNNENCGMCEHFQKVLDRLAEYEKTELEPEEIAGLINDYKDLNNQYIDAAIKLHCYQQSESAGLLIKLAMPDRAKIYIPISNSGEIFETHIEHRNTQIKNGKVRYTVCVSDSMGMIRYFTDNDIGKTVFLAKDEAEKALEQPDSTYCAFDE